MANKHSPTFLDHAMVDVSQHSSGEFSSTNQPRRDTTTPDIMNEIPLAHCQDSQHLTNQAATKPIAGAVVTMEISTYHTSNEPLGTINHSW